MPNGEIELDPIDFVTVGTVGPKGKRLFHLQAGQGTQLVSLVMEKEQARALGEALRELLDDLGKKYPDAPEENAALASMDMSLRDPIDPLFRISQMGLGYDETRNKVVLVAQELVVSDEEDLAAGALDGPDQPQVVRMWGTREQMRALSNRALEIVKKGRADPKSNGHLINYWT